MPNPWENDPWSNRPLDPGWKWGETPGSRIRPDGSIEWAFGTGPGYGGAVAQQTADYKNWAKELPGASGQIDVRGFAPFLDSRPPDPDSVAPRKTPQWRAAFDRQRNWMVAMAMRGWTPADSGISGTVGDGLSIMSSWGEILDEAKKLAQSGDWPDPRKYGNNPSSAFKRTDEELRKNAGVLEEGDLWTPTKGSKKSTIAPNINNRGPMAVPTFTSYGAKVKKDPNKDLSGIDRSTANKFGMDGSLPQYNDPKFAPKDDSTGVYGGWSGVYGNPTKPLGGVTAPITDSWGGWSGFNNIGSSPAGLTSGLNMTPMQSPATFSGFGGSTQPTPNVRTPVNRAPIHMNDSFGSPSLTGMNPGIGLGVNPAIKPQATLIRKIR